MSVEIELSIKIKYKDEKIKEKVNKTLKSEFDIELWSEDQPLVYSGELNDTVSYSYIEQLKETLKKYEKDIQAEVSIWYMNLDRDPDETFSVGFLNEEESKEIAK
jgi:hypothetical protein